jgi:hypothetical protein
MIVNFKAREISQDTRKLTRTPKLIYIYIYIYIGDVIFLICGANCEVKS